MKYGNNNDKKHALSSVRQVKEFYKDKKKQIPSFEKFAAEAIMTDVMDRRGIKNIFRQVREEDRACFNDVKKTWEHIIRECFDDFIKNETHELINGN